MKSCVTVFCFVVCAVIPTTSLDAAVIQFEVFGTNVGNSSTFVGSNYNSAGPAVAKLNTGAPMNGLMLLYFDNDNNGIASSGDTISVQGTDTGSFDLTSTNSKWNSGTFSILDFDLAVGALSDSKGQGIDSASMDWQYIPDSTSGFPASLSGVGTFSPLTSSIFNRVIFNETSPGQFELGINLWGGLLNPSDTATAFGSGNVFPNGLGIDLSLTGTGQLVPDPGPPMPIPEPAAWCIWLMIAIGAFAFCRIPLRTACVQR
ncbi:MAG: hypothetical protein Tsb009_31740 [Planctomycetaceae bacterium]